MRVLVDTPIWSAALRRGDGQAKVFREEMTKLVNQGVVEIIGPIRQELLSGIKEQLQFEKVRDRLRRFVDVPITVEDYEEAASYYNQCRSKGVQGSSTDFVICAIAARHDLAIFTDDRDFDGYSKLLPIRLYRLHQSGDQQQ
jgi:predicted nucleic acid-binding protein